MIIRSRGTAVSPHSLSVYWRTFLILITSQIRVDAVVISGMEILFIVVLPIIFSVNKHQKYNYYFVKVHRIFDLELVALRKARTHRSVKGCSQT